MTTIMDPPKTVDLVGLMRARIRVLIAGPPGCGKTGRIHDIAEQCGFEVIVKRASLSERIDFSGALVPDMEEGITKALPLDLLHHLRNAEVPTLLFLDDLGQAPMDVQAALMLLFDEGELSPNVLIWGATNRPGDQAGVSKLCEPLRTRFHVAVTIPTSPKFDEEGELIPEPTDTVMLGTWAEELAGWCDWAIDHDAAPEIVAWHRSTSGRTLHTWKINSNPAVRMPDYRSWETVMNLWNAGMRDLSTVAAAIGKPTAAEFMSFAMLADKLPTPDQVWLDPKGAPVPDESEASSLYLVASMLGAAADAQHVSALMQYLDRLPRVYGALLARDVFRRLGAKLSGNKDWIKWFTANQEIFAVGQ